MDALHWLQWWYLQNCDGDWEHGYGVEITTLDNPGWRLKVNLVDTDLEGRQFENVKIERNENDWIHCFLRDGSFQAAGGPLNLEEMILTFRKWANKEPA